MTAAVKAQLLAHGAKLPVEPRNFAPAPRKPAPRPDVAPAAQSLAVAAVKEPAEKHVQLPPAPPIVGPWAIGHWTARRSVAYEPDARVMLTGPADEFDKLLAHLQAFKP